MNEPTFKALCAEMLKAWDSEPPYDDSVASHDAVVELLDRARALLSHYGTAHPAPNNEAWNEFLQELQSLQNRAQAEGIGPRCDMVEWAQMLGAARPAPVPVGERPWERDGWCDDERCCWWWDTVVIRWTWRPVLVGARLIEVTHSLPHWALPLPGEA